MNFLGYNLSKNLSLAVRLKTGNSGRPCPAFEEYAIGDPAFPENQLLEEDTALLIEITDLQSISRFLSALRLMLDGYSLALGVVTKIPLNVLFAMGEEGELAQINQFVSQGRLLIAPHDERAADSIVGFTSSLIQSRS